MNVEVYIKEEALKLKNSRRKIEIAPEIDKNHFSSMEKKYKERMVEELDRYILVMSYTSTGIFFITGEAFYFDNFMQGGLDSVNFVDIVSVDIEYGKLFTVDKVILATKQKEYILDACIDGINIQVLKNVIEHIISKVKAGEGDFTVSEQGVLSFQLPEDIKLLYLEILCNYAYINDSIIDPDEYNAITKFSVRMELKGETRAKLRKYMNDYENRIKTGTLLAEIKKRTENQSGYWDAVKYCMMQDALYIHEVQASGKSWKEDGFIGSLMEHCSLNMEQIETMLKAVYLNKKMIKKDAEMEKVKKEWKELVKSVKETKGYVPTPYLFCSGSVYGLKSYDGFFKKDEHSQKSINKQRELILQELITNNQKAVNILIGDMNYIAERLEKALEREGQIEQDYMNIKQLIYRINAAMKSVKLEEECEEAIPRECEN